MTFNQVNKLPLVVAIQRGNTKMWVVGRDNSQGLCPSW